MHFGPRYYGIDCLFANSSNFWVFIKVDRDFTTPVEYIIEFDDFEETPIFERRSIRYRDYIIRAPIKY